MPIRRSRYPCISTYRATSFRLSSIASRNFIDLEVTEVWRIPYVNPGAQFVEEKAELMPRIEAVLAVHLWGGICDMEALWAIAERHGLAIVEDAAQAMGTRYHNRRAGSLGTVGCFSAHPLKIFNALGDAGFITTDSDEIASRVRLLRNHGLVDRDTVSEFGYVSRLDALQAVVLHYRLGRLDEMIERRRSNAAFFRGMLKGGAIRFAQEKPYEIHTFLDIVSPSDRRGELPKKLANKRG